MVSAMCATYSTYDSLIKIMDASLCPSYNEYTSSFAIWIVFSYLRAILSAWVVYLWLVVLFVPPKYRQRFQISSYMLYGYFWLLGNLFWLIRCRKISKVFSTPFDYPVRIMAASLVTFGAVTVNTLVLLFGIYQVYYFIDLLYVWKHDLESRPFDSIFIYLDLNVPYTFTVREGIKLIDDLIKILEPVFPCATLGFGIAYSFAMYSITVMLYRYKQYMLIIMEHRDESQLLKRIWKFSCHNAIFFPCNYNTAEFLINNIFLEYTFGFGIFFSCFLVIIVYYFNIPAYLLLDQDYTFYLSFIPTIIGALYFPFLVTKENFIKNKRYFAFLDSWYFLIGFLGSLLKGLSRYVIGMGVSLFLGFRAHVSIMPTPFDKFDSLYCSFYGSIVINCLNLGIIPKDLGSKDFSFENEDIGPARVIN